MPLVVVVLIGVLFGAGDQYLGTVHSATALGWWTITVSGLSAPWLVLPFLVGRAQGWPRRAVVAGLFVTLAGLAGYFAMTLTPMEGVHFHVDSLVSLLRTNERNVVGGLLTGPLFGWLGWRWRSKRDLVAAALVVGSLCLEPLAAAAVGHHGDTTVWIVEVLVGLAAAGLFLVSALGARHRAA